MYSNFLMIITFSLNNFFIAYNIEQSADLSQVFQVELIGGQYAGRKNSNFEISRQKFK